MDLTALAEQAATALRAARTLVVTAGAGMGVDSGLPDFRGTEGFWNAYPPYRRLGLSFEEAANPARFEGDPAFGWGFYGHRLELYRATVPHQGFTLLRGWIDRLGLRAFVVTSNVDGQFQRAGFDEACIEEVHGSIHHLQCTGPCSQDIWPNGERVPVDEASMRALHVPACPRCGEPARPNILMFGDSAWLPDRSQGQHERFEAFLDEAGGGPLVAIELGAGTAIPTIRRLTERLAARPGALGIRVNPREPEIARPGLSFACGALAGLEGIDRALAG